MLSEIEEQIRAELLKLMKHFQCPICLNLMSDPMVTRCVHHFCGECITKAIGSSVSECCRCPLCNEKITKRSLRLQIDVSDIITAFKEAVDLFEKDIKMSIMTDNDVVVFDISADRTKTTDSMIDDFNDTINESLIQNINESTDIESNRKTTTITDSDKTTNYETFDDNDEDMDITDIYFESTNTSINDKTNGSLNPLQSEQMNSVIDLNPTQSQNLRVNKSRITYSSSRPSTDDKFDRIIRLSENNPNFNQKSKEIKNESRIETESELKPNQRKPLTQLNKLKNKNKKFKRVVETSDSSDEDFKPIQTKNKKKVRQIIESDESESDNPIESKTISEVLVSDDNSEDLFLPSIRKNNSIESI